MTEAAADPRAALLSALAADYRVAFLRFLPRREEQALAAAYDLGRRAFAQGISILEVAQIHHDSLMDVLPDAPDEDVRDVATAASIFFLEVLATSDMAQRALLADD